jgi:anti-sigma factor RsiW
MSEEIHARAARLMDAEVVEGIPATERAWLDEHLEGCAACRAHAERTTRALQSLRSLALQVNPALVSATQVRLRLRARELREHQARMRALWISCALSWVLGAVSAPLLWRGLAWLGPRLALPQPAWVAVFLLAWTMPGVVVGAVLAWQRWRAASENGYAEGWHH